MKNRFRWAYLGCHEKWTVIEVARPFCYVIGNGDTHSLKHFKRDWGKGSKLGRYLKEEEPK